ncbi:MAG: lactate dehydrogenase [Candidatus Rokuibacteriota bacterium]|nr:MAG: lactate dehydrogenase [Candidatus Rokubacteria bacterium]
MSDAGRAGAPTAAAIATADALTGFTREVFVSAGMSDGHAAIVADVLVWASLRGVDSHGVARIPMYVRLIDDGDMNLTPSITVRTETVASVFFDADRAAGPIAMTTATHAAVRKARDAGIGMALVRATTHTAALGYYTLMAAHEGMAAISVSASTPFMAYHGTRVAGVSTNPISIAVPGGERGPVVLDMSTGVVARGRLVQASKAGQPIPAGWALDRNGNPTTDPREALVLLPQGGPKGSGLSLMIELITSLVASNPIIAEALEGTDEGGRHRQNGLVLAIDLRRYGDPLAFRAQVDRLIAALKALPLAPGVVEVLVPGERGGRTYGERSAGGVPVPPGIMEELRVVADRFRVPMFRSTR